MLKQAGGAVAIAAAILVFLLPLLPTDSAGLTDMKVLAVSMAFKLSAAVVAFTLLLAAVRLDDAWRRRRGYKGEGFFNAEPMPQALYLGLRYLACAVLVGLAIG